MTIFQPQNRAILATTAAAAIAQTLLLREPSTLLVQSLSTPPKVNPSTKSKPSATTPLEPLTRIPPDSPIHTTQTDLAAWSNGFSNCPAELPPTIVPLPAALPPDFPSGTYYRNGHAKFYADDGTPCIHPFDADGMIVAVTFDNSPAGRRNNEILFRNKYVETEGYLDDLRAGTMTRRGLFGTMKSGGIGRNAFRTSYKHVANTHVLHAGDSLYALWEGGLPYELDPLTLKNKQGPGIDGATDLDGLIRDNFGAHPRYDPDRRTYVNFGCSVFDPMKGHVVSLYEVDADTFRSTFKRRDPQQQQQHSAAPSNSSAAPSNSPAAPSAKPPIVPNFRLKAPALLHDFILTKNYCIFNINDTKINTLSALRALLGLSGFAGSIDLNESAPHTHIVLVPRSLFDATDQSSVDDIDPFRDERILAIPVDNHFNFHYANAYEDETTGNIVFDTVQIDGMDLASTTSTDSGQPLWKNDNPFARVAPSRLVRYVLDISNKALAVGTPNPKVLSTRLPEFPSIPPNRSTKRHRYVYPAVARTKVDVDYKTKGHAGPIGGIAKIDVESPENNEYYSFETYEFPGECVLCPKVRREEKEEEKEAEEAIREEDACYLLVNVVNGRDKTTDLLIFDVEGKGALERGPVLRCTLPVFVPHLLHGSFAEGVTFDFEPFRR
ncbi:hypothetical protein ACHAXS_010751 [Conticribra weissflogii]